MNKGIGGHVNAGKTDRSDDWITPRAIIEALGPFDLDPAACNPQPWPTARKMIAPPNDGRLDSLWRGRVWLNPPYSDVEPWIERLSRHGNGTALLFARTETKWFQRLVFGRASAIFFVAGRITFLRPDGSRPVTTAGGPSVLVAYDSFPAHRNRRKFGEAWFNRRIEGKVVRL